MIKDKDFTDFKKANSDLFDFTKEEIQSSKIWEYPVKIKIKNIKKGTPSVCDEILED